MYNRILPLAQMRRALFTGILVLSLLAILAHASSGDRAQVYKDCVASCDSQLCQGESSIVLPLSLRLTRWTCNDNCKYLCMHFITDNAVNEGTKIHQYHGKWPFWRLMGMQEPASVAFSLLNLIFHARGGLQVQKQIPNSHPMKWYYIGFAIVSINAWIWSSVFHTRDTPQTEKLDYFSAALAILYALFYTVVRLFHLYSAGQTRLTASPKRHAFHNPWAMLCFLAFLGHISYLTLLPRFDYTYNMAFNLIIGMSHNLLWLLYSLPSRLSVFRRFWDRSKWYRPTCATKAAVFVFLTTAATALELFDFPPWGRTIDAHSLWHLVTIPIAAFWYRFLIEDSLDEGWKGQKE